MSRTRTALIGLLPRAALVATSFATLGRPPRLRPRDPSTPVPIVTPEGQLSSYVVNVGGGRTPGARRSRADRRGRRLRRPGRGPQIGVVVVHSTSGDLPLRRRAPHPRWRARPSARPARSAVKEGTPARPPASPTPGSPAAAPRASSPTPSRRRRRPARGRAVGHAGHQGRPGPRDHRRRRPTSSSASSTAASTPTTPTSTTTSTPASSVNCTDAGRSTARRPAGSRPTSDHGTHVAGTDRGRAQRRRHRRRRARRPDRVGQGRQRRRLHLPRVRRLRLHVGRARRAWT